MSLNQTTPVFTLVTNNQVTNDINTFNDCLQAALAETTNALLNQMKNNQNPNRSQIHQESQAEEVNQYYEGNVDHLYNKN